MHRIRCKADPGMRGLTGRKVRRYEIARGVYLKALCQNRKRRNPFVKGCPPFILSSAGKGARCVDILSSRARGLWRRACF